MPDDPATKKEGVSRRQAITWLGAAGLAAVAAACGGSAPTTQPSTATATSSGTASPGAATHATASPVACVLSPEMTEGPYYIDGEAVRSDITEGKPGVPLRLDLTVVDASTCTAVPGAAVEVWHADAGGNYSGFNATASNTTFLRGVQKAGADGMVSFRTIYPGWYMGRATHIHLKVHVDGSVVHTGQLFFHEEINDAVYSRSPYNNHTGQRTTNAEDGIYADGGAQSTVRISKDGEGYVGAITLGVQQS